MGHLPRARCTLLLVGGGLLAACSAAPAAAPPAPVVAEAPSAPAPSAAPTAPEAAASSAPGTKAAAPEAPTGDDPNDGPCLDKPSPAAPPKLGKRKTAEALLAQQAMYLHVDARRPGLTIPDFLRRRKHLVLEIGHHMAIPIPDLKVDDDGISGTLSFKHQPFRCVIPWDTIYALSTKDGQGGVWDRDVPADAYCPE